MSVSREGACVRWLEGGWYGARGASHHAETFLQCSGRTDLKMAASTAVLKLAKRLRTQT